MTGNHSRRISVLECQARQQINPVLPDPPPGLCLEAIFFGWRARCFIIDNGHFRPYLPNFPDPYWKNATAWLNQFKAQNGVTADQLIEELLTYEPEHERAIDKARKAIHPED